MWASMWVYVEVFWMISHPELNFPKRAIKLAEVPLGAEKRGRQFAGPTVYRVGEGKVGAGTEWNEMECSAGIKLVWVAEVAECG